MDRQRSGGFQCTPTYSKQLHVAMGKCLPARGLALISRDGRVRWSDRLLVMVAILMGWQDARTMVDAFEWSRAAVVEMYVSRRRPGRTLAGFLEALQKASDDLLEIVVPHLRDCVRRACGSWWRWKGWTVLAVDGSRIDCPRTRANEIAFGCAGRKKTGPQQFLTSVFHARTGLVWDYRRGRADASEREHLRQMLPQLPRKTLLLMDAGYSGYELLGTIGRHGHEFIVRVGRNVGLLQKLGYAIGENGQTVYLWPQCWRDAPPLVLRRVLVGSGKKKMVLLTSVLDRRRLPDAAVADWYRRRWVVETSFRTLKQTLAKRKMLSDAPHKAQTELDWAMIGLWMLGLMAVERQPKRSRDRWSAAGALRSVRRAMRKQGRPPAGGLSRQLSLAHVDPYTRTRPKQARNWAHKKNPRPCGCPKVRTATETEVRRAQKLRNARPPDS